MDQNFNAQSNILRALGDSNAIFVEKFKPVQVELEKRKKFIESLISSFNNINDLISKCKNNIECFEKLSKSCKDLDKQIESFREKKKSENLIAPIVSFEDQFQYNNRYVKLENNTEYDLTKKNNLIIDNNRLLSNKFNTSASAVSEMIKSNNNQAYDFSILKNNIGGEISFVKPSNSFKKQTSFEKCNPEQMSSQYTNRFVNHNASLQGYSQLSNQNLLRDKDKILNSSDHRAIRFSQSNDLNYPNYIQNPSNSNNFLNINLQR